jgi:hypothetical protein
MAQSSVDLKSERLEKSATIKLEAPIDRVFPLFGPVREKDWAHGWDPQVIYPKDVLVAKHMVFQTKGGLHGSTETYTWTIVNYEPAQFTIEYLVSASDRLWFITVRCKAQGENTSATVTYSYTGLTPDGNQKNKAAIHNMFASDLKDWEKAINYYLKNGTQLTN